MEFLIGEVETDELIKKVQKLIKGIHYITIATADDDGNPWCSPLNCAFDEHYNFYWKSPIDCQHSMNIRANGKVFIVLFDSRVPVDKGIGIYFKGRALQIEEDNVDEVQKGSDLIAARVGKIGSLAMKFIKFNPRRVYKAIPDETWINTVQIVNLHNIDGRIKISLEQLK
jgi:general stress protein 26